MRWLMDKVYPAPQLLQVARIGSHAIGRSRGIAVRGRQASHGFHGAKHVVRRRFATSLRRSP
jgi:hypothetical protein